MSGALILTGAPGAGKSSVMDALGTLLEIDRIGYGAIDTDELARGWPWLAFGDLLEQLAAVIALQRKSRRDTFVVVATTETGEELREVSEAVSAEQTLVVCLTAPAELVADRVAAREPDEWPGKRALVEHARELADQIPAIAGIDALISTVGRDPRDVAAEVKQLLVERRIVARP